MHILFIILPIYGVIASILSFLVDKSPDVYEGYLGYFLNFGVWLITESILQNNLWLTYPQFHYIELFFMYVVINCIIWIPISYAIIEIHKFIKN